MEKIRGLTPWLKINNWPIGQDVQAYCSNRLVVLVLKRIGIERQGQNIKNDPDIVLGRLLDVWYGYGS